MLKYSISLSTESENTEDEAVRVIQPAPGISAGSWPRPARLAVSL